MNYMFTFENRKEIESQFTQDDYELFNTVDDLFGEGLHHGTFIGEAATPSRTTQISCFDDDTFKLYFDACLNIDASQFTQHYIDCQCLGFESTKELSEFLSKHNEFIE